MRLQIKGKNVEVSDAMRAYAEQKLGRLERQLADPTRVELELALERNPSISANHIAEATIWTKGPVLRARESAPDMRASIDLLADKLERQVIRYREKRQRRNARGHQDNARPADAVELVPDLGAEPTPIVKTKHFVLDSMAPDEAVAQLELVDHDFFVFRNERSGDVNVVYRRRDGDFGLIEPREYQSELEE
jgi:putative sigma-54 modulation protein